MVLPAFVVWWRFMLLKRHFAPLLFLPSEKIARGNLLFDSYTFSHFLDVNKSTLCWDWQVNTTFAAWSVLCSVTHEHLLFSPSGFLHSGHNNFWTNWINNSFFLGCPQSCWWLFWHFGWCSQSPHLSAQVTSPIEFLHCHSHSLSLSLKKKKEKKSWLVSRRHVTQKCQPSTASMESEFQSLMVQGKKEPPQYCILVVMRLSCWLWVRRWREGWRD